MQKIQLTAGAILSVLAVLAANEQEYFKDEDGKMDSVIAMLKEKVGSKTGKALIDLEVNELEQYKLARMFEKLSERHLLTASYIIVPELYNVRQQKEMA